MQTLGNPRDHFWRMIKMAKATNVDLSTALDEGVIDSAQYANMVHACRGCEKVGACDRLLARLPKLDQAPEYCVNGATFAKLKSI